MTTVHGDRGMTGPRPAHTAVLVGVIALAGVVGLHHATRWGAGITPDSVVYVGAARGLLAGHGVARPGGKSAEFRPVTHFPPLYSATLAAAGLLGLDPLGAARPLGYLLLACNVGLVGFGLFRATGGRAAPTLLGAALTAGSAQLLKVHGSALSEPLFLLLGFSGALVLVAHLEVPGRRRLFIAAGLTGLRLPHALCRRRLRRVGSARTAAGRERAAGTPPARGRRLRGYRRVADGALDCTQPGGRRLGHRAAARLPPDPGRGSREGARDHGRMAGRQWAAGLGARRVGPRRCRGRVPRRRRQGSARALRRRAAGVHRGLPTLPRHLAVLLRCAHAGSTSASWRRCWWPSCCWCRSRSIVQHV